MTVIKTAIWDRFSFGTRGYCSVDFKKAIPYSNKSSIQSHSGIGVKSQNRLSQPTMSQSRGHL